MGKDRLIPRVFPHIDIPVIPDGMVAVRLHGKLALIQAKEHDEPFFANSKFTERQLRTLVKLSKQILKTNQKPMSRGIYFE